MDGSMLVHSHHHGSMIALPTADPLAWAGFAAIFSYSFLMSWHCAGMCGPLACSILGRQKHPHWSAGAFYNAGRLLSYSAAGFLFGGIGASIGQLSFVSGLIVIRLAGFLLIVWALFPARFWSRLMPGITQGLRLRLQVLLQRTAPRVQPFLLGLVTLFLPCMTLHPLLLASTASGGVIPGGLTMLAFFLGTLPVMQTILFLPSLLARKGPNRFTAIAGRLLLALAGGLTIWRTLP